MAGSWRSLRSASPASPIRSARAAARCSGWPARLSMSIGLEALIYIALAGATMVLFWVVDRDERRRLATYAAALAGGTALGFAVFASYDNRLRGVRCLVAGVAGRRPARRRVDARARLVVAASAGRSRLGAAAVAGGDRDRLPRARLSALPVAARGDQPADLRTVAQECARGQAGLRAWLADCA